MMANKIKETPTIYCKYCGEKLERRRFGEHQRLEDLTAFKKRKYCSRECMRLDYINVGENNSNWSNSHATARIINNTILNKTECEICGKDGKLDIHHIDGNYQNNNLENLMCICRSCHNKLHRPKSVCIICGDPMKGHGYCNKHYLAFKKYGTPYGKELIK